MPDSSDMPSKAIDLRETFVHLEDDGSAALLPVGADFWTSMDPRLDRGRLVSRFRSEGDWASWERHPSGDELIILLSGRMTLLIERAGGEAVPVEMRPGQAAVVPQGMWHTADVAEASDAVFITPGEGTEHRPRS